MDIVEVNELVEKIEFCTQSNADNTNAILAALAHVAGSMVVQVNPVRDGARQALLLWFYKLVASRIEKLDPARPPKRKEGAEAPSPL